MEKPIEECGIQQDEERAREGKRKSGAGGRRRYVRGRVSRFTGLAANFV